jgi:Flp pilus assembly protein TadG
VARFLRFASAIRRLGSAIHGSQIAEFALGLPFLMVLLVGIFDFGEAFNTKQKINNAAREAARYASNQSTLDWSAGVTAPSIEGTRNLVSTYLINAKLPDCGLINKDPSFDSTTMTWTYRASAAPCPARLKVTIQRANTFDMNGTTVIATKVTISYPFRWHFDTVAKILFPKSKYPGPTFFISSDAVMANLT